MRLTILALSLLTLFAGRPAIGSPRTPARASAVVKPTRESINATWVRWQQIFRKKGGVLWNKPATGRVLGLKEGNNTRMVLSGNRHGGITRRVQSTDGQRWETQISPERVSQWQGYSVRYHDFKAGKRSAKKYNVPVGTPLTRIKLEGVKSTVVSGRTLSDIWGEGTSTIIVR